MRRSTLSALSLLAVSACSASGTSSVSDDVTATATDVPFTDAQSTDAQSTDAQSTDAQAVADTLAARADVVDRVADIVVADMMAAEVTIPLEDTVVAVDTTIAPDLSEPDVPVAAGCPASEPVGKQVGNLVPNMMFTDCETGESVAMHEQCGSGPIWMYAFSGW